jgi:hypothetical protein
MLNQTKYGAAFPKGPTPGDAPDYENYGILTLGWFITSMQLTHRQI